MGEFRAPGTLEAAPRPLVSRQSDGRQSRRQPAMQGMGLDLEFWRRKIVEEGPGPAPKAAMQAAQEEGADE